MLYTEEAVRAGLRVRDGKRVFYLPEGSRLTPAARDWLRQEGVTVVPHAETPPAAYRTPDGAAFAEKPEHMTHLRGNILVPKTHPRIAFRGGIDTLEAAFWCFLTTDNYKDAVLKAVNLGDDTDTTGAVTGALAGLAYGLEGIPQEWLDQLAAVDEVRRIAVKMPRWNYFRKIA